MEISNLKKNWKKILPNSVLLLSGILLLLFWPSIYDHILFKQWKLKPGTLIYNYWSVPPKMYLDVYFFNWTNSQDFTNHSIKPKFEEVGPFRSEMFFRKVNLTFNDDNSTVSYKKLVTFKFLPEESCGKMTDLITTPNVVALSVSNQARGFNIFNLKGVELSLSLFGQELHVTKPASELLFEGYEDPLINVASEIGKLMGYEVPFKKRYGWLHRRNDSTELSTNFTVNTTTSNIDQLTYWTGFSKPKILETNCSSYKGASGGELFPPDSIKNNRKISVFSDEMCRNLDLDFDEDTDVNGITGKKFISGDRMIDNGTKYPENECYCNGECVPSGVLNNTACRLLSPVFMSYPHFYLADQFYLDQIEGMKPEKEKHEFYSILEPTTSLTLKAKARVQLNILIKPIPRIKMYRNVPTKFLPVLWLEQSFEIDNQMTLLIKLMLWMPFIGRTIGFLMTVACMYLIHKSISSDNAKVKHIKEIVKNKELSPLVNNNINNNNINNNNKFDK